jgi:hypothetical protein
LPTFSFQQQGALGLEALLYYTSILLYQIILLGYNLPEKVYVTEGAELYVNA